MTRRDLAMRLAGVATIGAAWGACLWLRGSMLGPPHDPTMLEFLLVLASFVLTLVGGLLILNGEKLIGPRPPRDVTPFPERTNHWDRQSAGPLADDRAMLADILARRATRPKTRR
ncbi:MAG TPA: hypothetical protein VK533_05100 [Sphingomonas sp.]|uniref:hypothetical protein n=1 Tax=Sphingomonas sp. TaxID=28214 RepID=UPI002C4269EB|nr:hypothetical protein [Sphingomonas sp.]HMI18901.1 hypothetical protein [Sphingomonas sp.]